MLNVETVLQSLITLSAIMRLSTNLFLLAHQLSLTSGLRVIDNQLGVPVYGAEEKMVHFAILASDQKAALPSQVQAICSASVNGILFLRT